MVKWLNTPLNDVIQAAENIYGEIDCSITIGQFLMKEEKAYGMTTFADDGVYIELDAGQTYATMMETLAHELAHVVVGSKHDHDEVWEKAFDNIFNEYNRFGEEKYKENGGNENMKFEIGKCYEHTTGHQLHIISEINTCVYGNCLLGEDEKGELVPVGKEEANAENYHEISKEKFISNFDKAI